MQVKVTKKMVQELNKAAITDYCIDFFQLLEMSPEQYEHYFIDNLLDHENDYDASKNVMKVIEVVYKPEMYSIPQYLTTNDLIREYHPGDTLQKYIRRVINAVEI